MTATNLPFVLRQGHLQCHRAQAVTFDIVPCTFAADGSQVPGMEHCGRKAAGGRSKPVTNRRAKGLTTSQSDGDICRDEFDGRLPVLAVTLRNGSRKEEHTGRKRDHRRLPPGGKQTMA